MKHLLIRLLGGSALLVGCLMTLPSGADTPSEKWLRLEYPEERFRVRMPAAPHIERVSSETQYGLQQCVLYVSEGAAGDRFLVSFIDFPAEAFRDGPQRVLQKTRGGLVEAVGGKVIRERSLTLEGHPGLEIEIELPGGQILLWRAFVVNGRVYQLLAVTRDGKGVPSPAARMFLDSFSLMPGGK
jgi:hypothetical protein